jgi:hypothetical protein
MTPSDQFFRVLRAIEAADLTDTEVLHAQMLAIFRQFVQDAGPEHLEAVRQWPDDLILLLGRAKALPMALGGSLPPDEGI